MSQSTQQQRESTTSLRKRLAQLIAPVVGDEKTERWDTVTVEPTTEGGLDVYRITGRDATSTTTSDEFCEIVDYITINGTRIELADELQLDGGVAFEYYWSVDTASIDIHY